MKIPPSYFILALLVLLSSCSTVETPVVTTEENPIPSEATVANTPPIDHFVRNTYPKSKEFLIVAITLRFQDPNREMESALEDASRQVATYHGAHVSYRREISQNVKGTLQSQTVDLLFDESLAPTFLDKLEIIREDRGRDYYGALIKMSGQSLPDYPQLEIHPWEKPKWINKPPHFAGFITGVGVSGRRQSLRESWAMSDKLAMAEIAKGMRTNINTQRASIEKSTKSTSASTSAVKTTEASDIYVKGFYVLSRWREPDNSSYYSLAVVAKP